MTAKILVLGLCAPLLAACSSASSSETAGAGGTAPPASPGASSTAPPSEPPPAPPRTKYVSFLTETKPGEAPSLVYFDNATSNAMTLWLGSVRFFATKAKTLEGPEVGDSQNVPKDAEIGVHQEVDGSCVKYPFKSYEGPTALAVGASYTMRVTANGNDFYGAMTLTTPQHAFVAVRAELHDGSERATGSLRGSILKLDLGEPAKTVEFETDEAYRTGYQVAVSSKRRASHVVFIDKAGARFVATKDVDLESAPGFTAIVDDKPAVGAVAVVTLSEEKAN